MTWAPPAPFSHFLCHFQPFTSNSWVEEEKKRETAWGKLWKQVQLPRLFKSFNSNWIQLLECQFGSCLVGRCSSSSSSSTLLLTGKQNSVTTPEGNGRKLRHYNHKSSQGRLHLSVYLNFCNNLRQMRNVSVFSWVYFPQKLWGVILFLLFVLRLLLTMSLASEIQVPRSPIHNPNPGHETLQLQFQLPAHKLYLCPNFIYKHSGRDCKLSV